MTRGEGPDDGRQVGGVRPPGVGLVATLEGLALIVFNLLATPFVGRKRRQWGALGTEVASSLPGDDLVVEPKWSYTLGVSVAAPPEAVWPWIAQIGYGRGGFYSYQSLENMVGCGIANTTEILPEHQDPTIGADIQLARDTSPLSVERVEPPNALVLFGAPVEFEDEALWGASSWQFIVRPDSDGGSRFITRGRYDHNPNWKSRMLFGRFPLEAICFVMSRKMMLEIKRLAECSVSRNDELNRRSLN